MRLCKKDSVSRVVNSNVSLIVITVSVCVRVCVCEHFQMEVIKKAYHQESECEGVEVSPREVGHNIYILAQQVNQEQLIGCWEPSVHCKYKY